MSDAGQKTSRRSMLNYATLGASGVLPGASGLGLIRSCSPSADVVAKTRPEPIIDFSDLEPGERFTAKVDSWPLYVRVLSNTVLDAIASLPDGHYAKSRMLQGRNLKTQTVGFENASQKNIIRTSSVSFIALWRICTKRGCVPFEKSGDFEGFFCPCYASHYDLLGRFHKGIAPENMYLHAIEMHEATSFSVPRRASASDDAKLLEKLL